MMRKNLWIGSGVAVVVVIAGLLVYGSYISAQYQMEALQTAAHEQWVQLEAAIHQWAEAAPAAAAAVAPAAKQDEAALDRLKSARERVLQAHDRQAVMAASGALDQALDGVMAIGLSHPAVKQNAKFEATQKRLDGLRGRVLGARRRYNESLRNYNLFLGEFPNEIWAKFAGFTPDHESFPKLGGRELGGQGKAAAGSGKGNSSGNGAGSGTGSGTGIGTGSGKAAAGGGKV